MASSMAQSGSGEEDNKPEHTLNDREKELYLIAMMYCISSGPVKIDYEKFRELGGFNTLKTAQNTWSKIRGKIPKIEDGDEAGEGSAKKTPKSTKATPKKRAAVKKAGDDDEEDVEESPAKKKKGPAKKKVVAAPDVVPSIEKEEGAGEE